MNPFFDMVVINREADQRSGVKMETGVGPPAMRRKFGSRGLPCRSPQETTQRLLTICR